ncbi:MAG: hypothetical protein H0W54_04765 [Rubrobacter sp.]|nr:hypothetical protein [Rubrobacter sp.]
MRRTTSARRQAGADFQKVEYRLALSATPDRWYDDKGTAALQAYFGQTVYELTSATTEDVIAVPF